LDSIPLRTSKNALVRGKSRALSKKRNSIILGDCEVGSEGVSASRRAKAESFVIRRRAGQSELIY
jgi:hypothetical protein